MKNTETCAAVGAALLWVVCAAVPLWAGESNPSQRTWDFDNDRAGEPPKGFSFGRTGKGRPGRWVVLADKDAPSPPHVLAQTDEDSTGYRFPVTVVDGLSLQDLRLAVKCKPVSGREDQACGLVFRYKDENNYYVARANALEDNVNLYYVKDGMRREVTGWRGRVQSGAWHDLQIEAEGDRILVYFDGKKVNDVHDGTFPGTGTVGVWTKADSVTYFDGLTVTPR